LLNISIFLKLSPIKAKSIVFSNSGLCFSKKSSAKFLYYPTLFFKILAIDNVNTENKAGVIGYLLLINPFCSLFNISPFIVSLCLYIA